MTDIVSKDLIKQVVAKLERLEEEKFALLTDIREVMAEAKSAGLDTKVIRQVLKFRKMDKNKREEQETLLDLYLHALNEI